MYLRKTPSLLRASTRKVAVLRQDASSYASISSKPSDKVDYVDYWFDDVDEIRQGILMALLMVLLDAYNQLVLLAFILMTNIFGTYAPTSCNTIISHRVETTKSGSSSQVSRRKRVPTARRRISSTTTTTTSSKANKPLQRSESKTTSESSFRIKAMSTAAKKDLKSHRLMDLEIDLEEDVNEDVNEVIDVTPADDVDHNKGVIGTIVGGIIPWIF